MKKLIGTSMSSVVLALAMLTIYSPTASAEYSFQAVIPPGAISAQTFGINNAGKVTGGAEFPNGDEVRFTYDTKSGEYTTIIDDFSALEISNSGVMVGDVDGMCAIRDKKGNITFFAPPSYTVNSFCQARGVNSNGKVSGFEIDENNDWLGFVHDPKKGTFEEFLPSGQTFAHAINAQGQIAGSERLDADEAYPGSAEGRYGYVRETNGAVKYFEISQSFPGQTRARGISESGLITGFYFDPDTVEFKSYVTTLSSGTDFVTITLTDDQVVHQRPCNPANLTPPAGYELLTDMTASQIRNDGVVVGSCTDIHFNGTTGDFIEFRYGFIATPIK